MILRRLYLYLVSAASLGVSTVGIALLGTTALLFAFNDPSAQQNRTSLAIETAMVVVALPVWAIHFGFASRFARRDPADRASALRRLYLYAACLAGAVGGAIAIAVTAGDVLRPVIDTCTLFGKQFLPDGKPFQPVQTVCGANADWLSTAQAAWVGLVLVAMWAFHFRVAAADREAVGETGASATLRRWYMYAALLTGLLMTLSGLASTIQVGWEKIVHSALGDYQFVGDGLGLAIGGLALWGFHAWDVSRRLRSDDRHSTLRALQGFIAIAVAMVVALSGASMILYYGLARLLGVSNPGGVASSDVAGALASPASQLIVFGVAWVLVRRRLARDAAGQEADRQAGVRRLYTNLACLVSLAAWGVGASLLLGTLAQQALAPVIGVSAPGWKDPLSLDVTLVAVGVAVWLAHWRDAPWAADRQSLSRRLYVWAALLGSILAVLGGGVALLYVVLNQAFSAHPNLGDPANLAFGQYLAVVVVAAGIGLYHWRVLRADVAARPRKPATAPQETKQVAMPSTPAPVPASTVETAGAGALHYELVVTGATEDDIHQALAGLPPQANYHLTREAEKAAVDGG